MMARRGEIPDYYDFDELDLDAEEALRDFQTGILTVDELREQIGPEAAARYMEDMRDREEGIEHLFDDPEDC